MEGGKRKREEDPPSITYLVGDRSFDRLFKEQSLEELQNVVRRKLQLPSNSTVKLKQLRDSKVIDLDDDDDFVAFSARARLMRLVDVAVDISQTLPPANGAISSAGAGDAPSTSEKSVAKKKRKATDDQLPKGADATVAPEPKVKKRKTDQPATSIDTPESTEIAQAPKVAPAEGMEKPAPVSAPETSSLKSSAKPIVSISTKKTVPTDGEPPKKKSKSAKADTTKDAAEKPPKKTRKTGNAKETSKPPLSDDTAVPAPSAPSEPPKKSSGTKKVTTKLSALPGGESSTNHTVDGATASEKKKVKSKQKGKEVESQTAPSEPAPETSASTKGRKKVTIAEASEAPAPKEKKTKQSKLTKAKASDADAGPSLNPIDIQDIVNSIARASGHLDGKAKKKNTNTVNPVGTSQPSASSTPSVITTTKSGQEAIQNRLEELRKAGADEHQITIEDLESLLTSSSVAASSAKRNAADTTKPSRKHLETDDSEREATKGDEELQPSWTPLVPSNSLLSEVTVESRDEGSSSEEEDEFAQEPEQEEHEPEASQPSLDDVDLDAIMRGPTPIKLRNLIEIMESKEDGSDAEDEGSDIGPLEVEDDGEKERKYRRLSRRLPQSSEEEGDDDEDDGVDDDREERSPPPKQNISDALPSSAAPKSSAGPAETSNATDPAGSSVQGDAFDTDDTRVSMSKAPNSDKGSAKVDGHVPDLDKASDTSPARGTALSNNKTDNTNDDPIEPADDLVESRQVRTSDSDPIEVTTPPRLTATKPLSPVAHSTPKSGVAKRMKNRHGQLSSPSQFPVRADEPEVNGPRIAGAEETKRKKNVAARTDSDKPLIRGGKGATRMDLLRTSSQPVKRSETSGSLNGHSVTPSHSQPLPKHPPSLAKWAAIREPVPSIMMDELDSSSSPIGHGGILGELAGKADRNVVREHSDDDDSAGKASEPLFTLTASQVPFPYSQYNAPVQKRVEVVSDSESGSEAEVGSQKTKANTRRSIGPYRKLTDIASLRTLFSQSTPVGPGPSPMTSRKGGQADDDDDETSSSESDDEGQSHIPEAKRAGKLRSKKTKGLLASLKH